MRYFRGRLPAKHSFLIDLLDRFIGDSQFGADCCQMTVKGRHEWKFEEKQRMKGVRIDTVVPVHGYVFLWVRLD